MEGKVVRGDRSRNGENMMGKGCILDGEISVNHEKDNGEERDVGQGSNPCSSEPGHAGSLGQRGVPFPREMIAPAAIQAMRI